MSSAALEAVLEELQREEGFLIDLVQQLVRIPTVNPKLQTGSGLNHEADLQYYLRAVLDGFGMRTESYDVFAGRPNLVGVLPGAAARSLILGAHVDVAPVGATARWTVDPFGAEIIDGRLHGRGALAMKAGLGVAVAVARALCRSGVLLEGQLELHAVVDGLGGGFGARDLVRRGRRAAGLVSPRPTGGSLVAAQVGQDWLRMTLRGRPADAMAGPEQAGGINAVQLAIPFLSDLRQFAEAWADGKPPHELLPGVESTLVPGVVLCGAGLGPNGLPLLLTSPGTVPDVAVIDFVLALLPNHDPADAHAEIEALVRSLAQRDPWLREMPPRVQWDLHGRTCPPFDTSPDHPLVVALVESCRSKGEPATVAGSTTANDAGTYAAAGVPAVLFGPAGDGQHGPDEYVEIASMLAVARTLAALALRWCGVE